MKLACLICGTLSYSLVGKIEGYRANTFFDVHECSTCRTSSAHPHGSDEKIYDAIYSQIAAIPGYNRYLHYAQQVLKEEDPLHYLMNCDDSYWGIAKTIMEQTRGQRSEICIWEIGCGHGYLTYALRKAGYKAIGLDISESAIASARHRYGEFFFCEDAKEFFLKTHERPSFIILSEVIEHLPDPVSFISELLTVADSTCTVIVTTPNKADCKPEIIWDTELPPVHLWWFTSKGLEILAERMSCRVAFANLNEFYKENVRFRKVAGDDLRPRTPILDSEYRVISPNGQDSADVALFRKQIVKRMIPQRVLRQIQIRKAGRLGLEECVLSAPTTLCAIYSAGAINGDAAAGPTFSVNRY